jgi:hypothetical protein
LLLFAESKSKCLERQIYGSCETGAQKCAEILDDPMLAAHGYLARRTYGSLKVSLLL